MRVFGWEQAFQGWVARVSAPLLRPLTALNFIFADEVVILCAIPALFLVVSPLAALIVGLGLIVTSSKVEWHLKDIFKRGRPRDPNEWGIPSGDAALVSIWAPAVLGLWAVIPIGLVAWARLARNAHWPLDVIAGIILGLWLSSPIWYTSVYTHVSNITLQRIFTYGL